MKYFRKRLIPFFSLVCVLFLSVLLFNCERDEIPESANEEVVQSNRVQVNTHENVSKSALDFIRTKTNNSFKVLDYKGKITLANSAVNAKNTAMGTVDTDKEIVVVNETNIKHTFKVINNENNGNVYTNLIVVETENSTYEYFLKYMLNDGVSIHDAEGNLDFSQFQGRIETYNSEGVLIGDVQIENGNITVQSGQLAPCPDEPVEDTTNTNDEPTDGNDTASSSTSTGVPGSDSGSGTNNSTSNGGWFASSDDGGCGLSWSYAECGCGGTANGHAPSGPDCCAGSPLTITDCNGNVVAQGRTTNNTTLFKRDIFDPCDDGDVGVILDEEDIKESILECINSADLNDTTTIAPEILNQTDLMSNDWSEINNYLDENNCSEEAQEFAIEIFNSEGEIVIDFEIEMILKITETQEFKDQTCLKSIKDDVIAINQISKIIKKFEPTYPVLHLEWGVFNNSNWGNTGQTSLNDTQDTAFINLNTESLTHVSNIVMVKTIVHEIIHAELYRKLKELVDDYNIISIDEYNSLRYNYQGIAHYTMAYGNVVTTQSPTGRLISWGLIPDYSLSHHNQMASFYRETIIKVMKDYDIAKGITRSNAQEFYEALSWAGLKKTSSQNGTNSQYTDAWKKFKEQIDIDEANIPMEDRTYNKYLSIINQEYYNSGINCN